MATLSRRYRPQTFAEITGQNAIKQTLIAEAKSGNIAHAYLFGGPRGVGKTTTARVFAKALNCLEPKDGEPCNACRSCTSVNEGSQMDVIEMDAASNTGVDNVREAIIEHVRFTPSSSKYKVYILDEAHMLSSNAWNALLKTLEEPPAYAVFILITTELHKVPATILSRCQRFDFKRIPEDLLSTRVNKMADDEGVKIDAAVLKRIVAKSDGCLRDAESLLGQLISLGEKKITTDIADLVLPVSHIPIAADFLSVCAKRELGASMASIAELEEQGIPLLPLFDDIIDAIRLLLLASDSVAWRTKLADGDEGERKIASLVNTFEPSELADMALLLMERRRDAKQGVDARFCLELAAAAITLRLLPHADNSVVLSPPRRTKDLPTTPVSFSVKTENPSQGNGSMDSPIKSANDTKALANDTKKTVSDEATLRTIQSSWSLFIREMDARSPSITFILRITKPVAMHERVVTLAFQYPYHLDKVINDIKTRRLVEDALRKTMKDESLRIEGVVGDQAADAAAGSDTKNNMVDTLLQAFGGQLVDRPETPSS